ncbi:response regulator [Geomonas sp. Red276]
MNRRDILLVDDDHLTLTILSTMLESCGFDVAATSDGARALEMMAQDRFGMLITDFEMPEMTGVELAARVRQRYPDLPVVMVTGSRLAEIAGPAAEAGVCRVLPKPVNFREFMAAIDASLPARGSAA